MGETGTRAAQCGERVVSGHLAAPQASVGAWGTGLDRALDLDNLPELVELGRYQIVCGLGRGSHGLVYEAFDCHLGRHVAIKVFTRWESLEDIEREAFALARIQHPNVVVVHDLGIESGLFFLVMEQVHGGTLRQRAQTGVDWRELVRWFVQAARGLQAVHDAKLVHGDIKPSNILVDHQGRAQLIDFSLCGRIGEPVRGGTPKYLPPEREDCDLADPRSDQYSLAASLLDLVGEQVAGLQARILYKALQRAMARDPAERFACVGELAEVLERICARRSMVGLAWRWLIRHGNSTRLDLTRGGQDAAL